MTTTLNDPLQLAFNYAQFTNRNIFLTGKAGTGKTTFLKRLREQTHKRLIVVAPTGVAAINAGGVTIHSFFQLAPGLFLPNEASSRKNQKYSFSKHKINILRSLDLLVIDEISMVRCDLLDAIDDVLRRYQDRNRPFGGVQLLMIGDLQQLAPVTTDSEWQLLRQFYTSPYFFASRALGSNYTTIELQHVYRQADSRFVDILNEIRDGRPSAQTLSILASRCNPNFRPADDEGYITLTTHNYQAQDLNALRLMQLETRPYTYSAVVEGDFPEGSYPTDAQLVLKEGAQVMFCKNDTNAEKRYYNGKIGRVVRLAKDNIEVLCPGETEPISVEPQTWLNMKYLTDQKTGEITESIAGSYTQIPLKTAWAITIHKSQGLTFDRAIINAGSAFSYGQVYVALSRCRSLEGLVLTTPITPGVVTTDPQITQFNRLMEQNQPNESQLLADKRAYFEELLCRTFDFEPLQRRLNYIVRLCEEHLTNQHPAFVSTAKRVQGDADIHLTQVGVKFGRQIRQLMPLALQYAENLQLQERVSKATVYFLDKAVDVMQEFIDDGLPAIGNKTHREQIEREWGLLSDEFQLKTTLLNHSIAGFTLDRYWKAKAMATMNSDSSEGKKKTNEANVKASSKRTKKTSKTK